MRTTEESCAAVSAKPEPPALSSPGDLGFSADEGQAHAIVDVRAAVNLPTVRSDESEDAHSLNKSG